MALNLGCTLTDRATVQIDAASLRTHGVVLGMTGSGKTGLSLVLLEELAMAGVPIIAIDPKGDLANLGLVFPNLSAQEFAPWTPHGEDPAAISSRYQQGLAQWGLQAPRVAALAEKLAVALDPLFPSTSFELNWLLCETLAYLQADPLDVWAATVADLLNVSMDLLPGSLQCSRWKR